MSRWFAENVIDDAGVFLSITGRTGEIVLFNKEAERLSGYSRDEVLGKPFFELLDEKIRDFAEDCMEKALENGKFVHNPLEMPIRLKSGEKRFMEWRSTVLKDEKGEAKGAMCIAVDITERKIAEEQGEQYMRDMSLLASSAVEFMNQPDVNSLYRNIADRVAETIPNSVVVVDSFDPKSGVMKIEAIEGHEDGVRAFIERLAPLLSESEIIMDELGKESLAKGRIVKVPGKLHVVSCGCLDEDLCLQIENEMDVGGVYGMGLIHNGEVMGGVVIILLGREDIENISVVETLISQSSIALRKRLAEKSLSDSHKRLLTVLDSLDAMVYVVDLESYEILFINKYGKDRWGDIEGMVCWQTIQQGMDRPCPFCTNDKIVDGEGRPTEVYRWEFKNTSNGRWYYCRDRALAWVDGRMVRMEIAADITKQKEVEEALKESERRSNRLLGAIPDIVFRMDSTGRVLDYKSSDGELYASPEDFMGKLMRDVLPPNVYEPSEKAISAALKTGEIQKYEYELDVGSGTQFYEARFTALGEDEVVAVVRNFTSEKNAQNALKESERRFRETMETVELAVVSLDTDGDITFFNDFLLDITGWQKEDVLGKNWFDMFVDTKEVKGIFKQGVTKGQIPAHYENEIRTRDGGLRLISWSNTILRDDKGTILGTNSIGVDITERKRDETALRESRDLFSDILDIRSAGLYRIMADSNGSWGNPAAPPYSYLFMNDQYCEMTGISREEHMADPKATLKIIHPEDYESFSRANTEANSKVIPFHWDGRVVVEGKTKWFTFESHPRKVQNGKILWTGMMLDITRRKEYEKALEDSKESYRSLVAGIPGAVYRCDNDPRWTMHYISDYVEKIVGFPASDFMDGTRNFDSIIHHEDKAMVDDTIQKALERKEPYNLTYRVLNRDGDTVWVGESGCGIFDDNNQLTHLDGVILNITAEILLAEENRLQKEKYMALFNNAPLGIVTISSDGHLVDINHAVMEMFNVTPEEVESINVLEFPLFKDAGISDDAKRCMETCASASYQRPYTTSKGKSLVLRYTLAPLLDNNGNVTAIQAIMENVSDSNTGQ